MAEHLFSVSSFYEWIDNHHEFVINCCFQCTWFGMAIAVSSYRFGRPELFPDRTKRALTQITIETKETLSRQFNISTYAYANNREKHCIQIEIVSQRETVLTLTPTAICRCRSIWIINLPALTHLEAPELESQNEMQCWNLWTDEQEVNLNRCFH